YRKRLARVTRHGKAARASKGDWNGDPPYGYVKVAKGETRHQRIVYRLELEPFEAEGVHLAFQMCLAGHTALQIAQRLNELGHRTHAKGKRISRLFSKDTVLNLLSNVFYNGVVT